MGVVVLKVNHAHSVICNGNYARVHTHSSTSLSSSSSFFSMIRVLWDNFTFVAASMTAVICCVVHAQRTVDAFIWYDKLSYVYYVHVLFVRSYHMFVLCMEVSTGSYDELLYDKISYMYYVHSYYLYVRIVCLYNVRLYNKRYCVYK